ncbi:Gag-Pol polyprotein, partial [Mucuna pruriens]
MCDASSSALGAVLGQRAGVGKPVHVIVYASRTMDPTQLNYTTIENELLEIGAENSIADHLSRIERESDPMPIRDEFRDEQLLHINTPTLWFANICNFVAASQFPPEASRLYKEKLKSDAKYYIWDDPYLWRLCNDQHLEAAIMDQLGQPEKYLTTGSIGPPFSETPINSSPPAKNAIATKIDDAKVVVDFLKSNIFCRFGVLKALISDQGSHFCNRAMSVLLHKYGVVHRIPTVYNPQTNGQVEVFNREIKKTLQEMANPSQKDWSQLLEDALWAHRTTYQTSLGMSPY